MTGAYIPAATASLFVETPARSNGGGEDAIANAAANAVRDGAITTGTEAVHAPTQRTPNGMISAVPARHKYGVSIPDMHGFGAMCRDDATKQILRSDYASIAVDPERTKPVRLDGMPHSEWEAERAEEKRYLPPWLLAGRRLVVTCNLESSTLSFCMPDHTYAVCASARVMGVALSVVHRDGHRLMESTFN